MAWRTDSNRCYAFGVLVNIDEADRIIAELNICFPNKNLLVEEVIRWEENLADYEYSDARRAIKRIEDTCKFWPAWAEFKEAIQPFKRERVEEMRRLESQSRELAMPTQTEEEYANTKAIIKQLRSRFTNNSH